MRLDGNTVLITGGSNGIGLALAERFLGAGSSVIICGRSEARLAAARERFPALVTHVCDVANASERIALAQWALAEYPALNVVINNAGIQNTIDLTKADAWARGAQELEINIAGPIHLTTLFLPHLLRARNAALATVSSGLAFVPIAAYPVYCATKAAIHSFTLSLRAQVGSKGIYVAEICPPHVNTDLNTPGSNTAGMPLGEFADAAMDGFERGDTEITCGFSSSTSRASRDELDTIFTRLNAAHLSEST